MLPKRRRPLPAVLTLEAARRLLRAAEDERSPVTEFRNRAILSVLLFCGLHRAEVADGGK